MYVLYNMHWEPHVFGLPHLPKGQTWHVLYDTSKGPEKGVYGETAAPELKDQSQIAMMPRSIVVLCGQPGNGAPEEEGGRELPAPAAVPEAKASADPSAVQSVKASADPSAV